MKHHRWSIHLGVGVLLAGGGSLPASALEGAPEPVAIEPEPELAQLRLNVSPAGMGVIELPLASAPEFSEVAAVLSRDRLGAEFVEAVSSNDEGLIAQAEGLPGEAETDPLLEEAIQLEQAETILDEDEVPAGGLLQSGTDALEREMREAVQAPEPPLGDAVNEADAPEAEELDSEAFEFDEDELEGIDAEPTEATVEEESLGDPDLGILRLRERPLAQQKSPVTVPVFLVGNVGYVGNGNTLADVDDPVNDRLFRSGLSLIASPRLSKRTTVITSVQGNLYRYDELSRLNYNEVRVQASLRQVITRRVYGDLGWTHRQLFLQDDGDRFLHENAAFASLTRRDPLTKNTSLTSFYNLRASFADPETSSRLRNTLGLSLRHDLTPALQASLTGRATLTNFTQQSRQDFYTQALAQLSYRISKNFRLSLFGSLTRGNSSNRQVDFDNSTLGVSLSGNVKLF